MSNSSSRAMDSFQDAHYYTLPTQGNVYTYVDLHLTNGSNKALFGILKRKVFCCEFTNEADESLTPVVKEVPFTYIPAGAEIISMDAFNRSTVQDDFYIGISIIKVTAETTETYLNVYTEQDHDEKAVLNLDSIGQNCMILELSFTPYQLYHTYVINKDDSKEVVWLLSGSDVKIHLFREDPQNHTYCESDIEEVFPEFNNLPSILLSMDVSHTPDYKKRFSVYGCECGIAKLFMVDNYSGDLLREFSDYSDAPVSCVRFMSFNKAVETTNLHTFAGAEGAKRLITEVDVKAPIHVLVTNTYRLSAVFMDIDQKGLRQKRPLQESDKHDAVISCCITDIDMDGNQEIILGTFSQMLLVYKYDNKWKLISKRRYSHAIHAIGSTDLSGDGAKELIIATMSGIHILQHKPVNILKVFYERLASYRTLMNDVDDAVASNE